MILEQLGIWTRAPRIEPWRELVDKMKNPKHKVTIGIIGKYVDLVEAYKSLHESLVHGGIYNDTEVNLKYVNAEDL